MLEIQGLSKSYGNNVAVDNVNFTVLDGQIGILLGPNGAGKSTIIKSIAGFCATREVSVSRGFRQEPLMQREYLHTCRRSRACLTH